MKPRVACTNCRLRKKRCDKGYPICSYCLSTHAKCVYQRRDDSSSAKDSTSIPIPLLDQASSEADESSLTSFFLDRPLWNRIRPHISPKDITLTSNLKQYSENISFRELLTLHAVTLGVWLPCLSHSELANTVLLPPDQLSGKQLLLLLCLDLFSRHFTSDEPRNELYLNLKSAVVSAEIEGAVSLQVLQALVLILFYEFAHGIYPAAFFTLGTCAQLMSLLGVDEFSNDITDDDWHDIEARRRIWWAVNVLERRNPPCVTVGCPERTLYLSEPGENTPLPCDDASWEYDQQPTEPSLTITSQVVFTMGKSRLLAHASFLLSKAIGYASKANDEDVEQLERTILALVKLPEITDEDGITSIGGSRAILHSTLLLLRPAKTNSLDTLETVQQYSANYFLVRSTSFLSGGLGSLNMATPFLLPWSYKSYKYFLSKSDIDGRPESIEALKVLGHVLNILNQRWRLSGVYSALLRIHQELQS